MEVSINRGNMEPQILLSLVPGFQKMSRWTLLVGLRALGWGHLRVGCRGARSELSMQGGEGVRINKG